MQNDNQTLLSGFEFVPSDAIPSITLDNQRRFYLNTSARRLIDAKPYDRYAIAYSSEDKALAIVKGSTHRDASTSVYNVDKRYYMSARYFSKQYGYKPSEAPFTFVYERGASDGSVFIFRLT